jgi:hypothetical protein
MRHWTPAERLKQAELIRQWQPWNKSTGARTTEGKARVSRNAFKGGLHTRAQELLRDVSRLLREQRDTMNRIK